MTVGQYDRVRMPVRAPGARTTSQRGMSAGASGGRPAASRSAAARTAPARQTPRPASARTARIDRPMPSARTGQARPAPARGSAARTRQAAPSQKKRASAKQRSAANRQGMAALRLVALVALLALAAYLTKAKVFVLREVSVEGNRGYSESEIASMAALTPGENIFDVSRDAVERSLSAHSDVKLLDFRVTYPDTVYLSVSERQARAAVNCAGVILLVDEEGGIMDRLSSVPEGSVVVSGMDVSVSAQGRRIESAKSWQLTAMKNVLAEMDAQGMLAVVSELNVADRYNLYLVSNTGVKIVLGDEENMAAKLVWARTVLEKLTQDGVRRGVLDVSTGKNAVYADR